MLGDILPHAINSSKVILLKRREIEPEKFIHHPGVSELKDNKIIYHIITVKGV